MVAPNNEQVEYDIILRAAQAMKELKELTAQATTFDQKIQMVTASVKKFAAETGLSVRSVKSIFKEIDAIMSDTAGKSALFGKLGKEGWDDVGKAAETNSQRVVRGFNAIKIALGTIEAIILFRLINAFETFFRGAIDQARQFEATLYRLANAERQLSQEGIEVGVKQLKEGITEIQEALPIFSKEDVAQLVGSVATTTKEVELTGDEVLKLGAAIAILNVNSTETETLLQTQAKVTNSLISPQAKSIGNLGLSFGKAKMEAKAFEMQLLSAGESFKDLTEKEKTQIKYQIILETAGIEGVADLGELKELIESAGGDFQALNEYLESNDAKLHENAAAWKDLQTVVGQVIIPFIPALTEFFSLITNGFNTAKVVIIEFVVRLVAISDALHAVITGTGDFTSTLKSSMESLRAELTNVFFKEIPKDAPDWFMKGWGKHIKEQAETATGPLNELGEAVENVDFSEFEDKIEDILQDAANAREDLQTKVDRKLEDIDEEYRRKALDAETDLSRKIEDINRRKKKKKEDALAKAREDDLKAEQDYQNKLWELRMRYLMDLEEALHARDARQVLRLMKQYAFDKEALLRKKEQEDQARAEALQADLERIEIERQRRLADAQLEYQQKLADQRIAKQRELEDLKLWRDRELDDIKEGIKRKAETLIQGWIQEGKITQAGAQQVYDILKRYFGPEGLTDQLYAYMMNSLASAYAGVSSVPGAPAPYFNAEAAQANTPQPASGLGTASGGHALPFAEGGTLLATRPTTVTFGEVPEVVSFTPLNGGNNVGKMFGDKSDLGGGILELLLTISPDLESRIVRRSMDETANVIVKVNRSK